MKASFDSDKVIKEKKLIRKDFPVTPKWGMPILNKITISDETILLLRYDNTKKNETNIKNLHKAVHFFIDDSKLNGLYNKYNIDQIKKLAQYKYVLTPDFSLKPDMPLPVQIYNVFKSRWCGTYWQSFGLDVIPTISWSDERSYDFCFEGIEKGSAVAISTLGCKSNEELFMNGYKAMMKTLEPSLVICYDKPFKEMKDDTIHIEYRCPRGGV
jgi:hypothetical protein